MTNSVADEVQRTKEDEQLGKFARQQHDLFERARRGSFDMKSANHVMKTLCNINSYKGGPLFVPPEQQIVNVQRWNDRYQWGFTPADFTGLERLPELESKDAGKTLTTLVLDIRLKTVSDTVFAAWVIICNDEELPAEETRRHMEKYAQAFGVIQGCGHSWGLRWYILNLDGNRLITSEDLQKNIDPILIPHSAVLWAAAHHPGWLAAINGKDVPSVLIAGYTVDSELVGLPQGRCVPTLSPDGIRFDWIDTCSPKKAIPQFSYPVSF